jgi:hypothetical protein
MQLSGESCCSAPAHLAAAYPAGRRAQHGALTLFTVSLFTDTLLSTVPSRCSPACCSLSPLFAVSLLAATLFAVTLLTVSLFAVSLLTISPVCCHSRCHPASVSPYMTAHPFTDTLLAATGALLWAMNAPLPCSVVLSRAASLPHCCRSLCA